MEIKLGNLNKAPTHMLATLPFIIIVIVTVDYILNELLKMYYIIYLFYIT